MKIFKYLFLAALATQLSCESADRNVDTTPDPVSTTGVSGEVSGVWSKNSTINVSGDIIVPAGKRLVIEEGVTVIMDPVKKPEFIVFGNLYSQGTADNPVRITTTEQNRRADSWGQFWGGILGAPSCQEMLLDHTIIEYGGATTTQASLSVKYGLYKAVAGENLPAIWFSNNAGKLVLNGSTVKNFHDDATYFDGGNLLITGNKFYTTGATGGEGVNIKSGCTADVSFNLFYSDNTNALKLSNAGGKSPQAHAVAYNNTIINTGWRRPSIKGGSVWLEAGVYAEIYNTIFANARFGIKQDSKNTPDARTKMTNNLYFAYTQSGVTGFTPNGVDILKGTNDIIDTKTAGANNPLFTNYPVNTDLMNAIFNTGWDFRVKAGSPAIGAGRTDITRNFPAGITINGVNYASPSPSSTIGAFGAN